MILLTHIMRFIRKIFSNDCIAGEFIPKGVLVRVANNGKIYKTETNNNRKLDFIIGKEKK